jgi:hypothetical protein
MTGLSQRYPYSFVSVNGKGMTRWILWDLLGEMLMLWGRKGVMLYGRLCRGGGCLK